MKQVRPKYPPDSDVPPADAPRTVLRSPIIFAIPSDGDFDPVLVAIRDKEALRLPVKEGDAPGRHALVRLYDYEVVEEGKRKRVRTPGLPTEPGVYRGDFVYTILGPWRVKALNYDEVKDAWPGAGVMEVGSEKSSLENVQRIDIPWS